MKKIIAIALTLVMTLTFFAGCSQKDVKLTILDESLQAEEYGIAFKKGNDQLHNAVISTLDAMMEDGKAAEISKKWFGKDIIFKGEAVEKAELPEGMTKFVMGLDDSFPPMGYRNEKNEIVGFDIDLATEVCKRLGVELVLQPIEWASKELELDSGNIDCIWNGLTITDARKEAMLLSRPYLANNQVIVVAENSNIKSKADLEGKKIAVQTGSSGEEALMKDEISGKAKEIIQMAEYVSALQDLRTGRIDAVVIDEVVARYYISNN